MNHITRRTFLRLSATAAAGLYLAACQPIQAPTPGVQDVALPTPLPLPEPVEIDLLDDTQRSGWEGAIARMMEEFDVPGMGIGVVRDGQVVYAKGHGVANLETGAPVTTLSLFQLADLTHTFTATAAMQLVEQGKLELEQPVVEVLPYFRLDDERYTQITVRHLLTESAGLPPTRDNAPALDWQDQAWAAMDDDEALERYVRSLAGVKLVSDPGKQYKFCNMAFDIAGAVIAKASGEVFEEVVSRHILQPLGMHFTTFDPQRADPSLRVEPYIIQSKQVVKSELVTYCRERAPSVGLFSNVTDLNRWLQANLNLGELEDVRILQAATYDQLWGEDINLSRNAVGGSDDFRSLGWFTGTLYTAPRLPVRRYDGHDVGFHTAVVLLPDIKYGVLVLGNMFASAFQTEGYASGLTLASPSLLL